MNNTILMRGGSWRVAPLGWNTKQSSIYDILASINDLAATPLGFTGLGPVIAKIATLRALMVQVAIIQAQPIVPDRYKSGCVVVGDDTLPVYHITPGGAKFLIRDAKIKNP